MSLRPPSTPSPSPHENGKAASRQSMGPSTRGAPGLPPASPRLGAGAGTGTRPTSELLGNGAGMFQSPEADAIEQWFDSLQNYETTLEEMAAASLDVNFKEELSAIEQWFKVLSEAERTAALYSLLQHSTQVQIRFFITVLTQMSKSDPMTALLSPQIGGSMQSQMEAKLASIKSPSLKSGLPASPTMRNFAPGNRSSLALDSTSNFLSPESAATSSSNDAAATLAQQRAKLKASSAAAHPHRISAPVLTTGNIDGRPAWTSGSQLGQVSEQNTPAQEGTVSRPKSTEFTGGLSPRPGAVGGGEVTVPANDSWASMVNTPLIPMFKNDTRPQNLDAAANKLSDWSNKSAAPGVPRMGDPTIHRRTKPASTDGRSDNNSQLNVYDDNGNLIGQAPNQSRGGAPRNVGGNNNNSFGGGPGGWSQTRSPALSNTSSNSPTLGMGMPGLAGMASMNPFNMNMLNMGLTPEQLLAAQLAATGFGQPNWMGMQPVSAGLNGRRGPQSGRSPGLKSASSVGSRADGGTPKAEDDVDPALLNDVPAWLRSLRLHKYTPNFEGCKWQDMVVMDEAALEAKGVAALGARRKMLKTFDLVRKKMGMDDGPASSAPPTSATLKSP
ncbi:Protein VTS1 [Termitomyces sp. J132]|nr:Protein VTS1 [Termitomyces sp. J132]